MKAGLVYFALVFGAGFLLALVRVPLVVPLLGVRFAELLEMPLMFVAILLSAQFVVARFTLPAAAGVRIGCGVLALAVLVAAELALVLVQGHHIADYVASRDSVSGSVYLVMLAVFAAMPLLIERLKPPPAPSA
jgi:hypothetical protein